MSDARAELIEKFAAACWTHDMSKFPQSVIRQHFREFAEEVHAAESQLAKREEGEAGRHEIREQCAHYGGLPARCLFETRKWSPGSKPQRCKLCPSALTHPAPTHEDESGEKLLKDCAICGAPHDNDVLSDICRDCEASAPWRDDAPDHTSGEVTEAMVQRALIAIHDNPDPWPDLMRAALEAALRGEAS